jgi:ADP-L-glycero-D-manno-heptose 6-epimerase
MIILTGIDGFIAKHVEKLLDGAIVHVTQDNCLKFLNTFTAWSDVKYIYHLGAISDTTCTDIKKIYKYNVEFTLDLLQKAIEHKIPIRYASSASIYGNTYTKINPLNHYAMSKATIDLWVEDNIDKFAHIQGLRFFNVYGNGEENKLDQASPISKFKKQIQEHGTITVFEDSEFFYRDFICVEDVAEVMVNNKLGSGIYDLGTGKPISFLTVAKLMQQKFGGAIKTIPFPNHLLGKYQTSTKAKEVFLHPYKSVLEWLNVN